MIPVGFSYSLYSMLRTSSLSCEDGRHEERQGVTQGVASLLSVIIIFFLEGEIDLTLRIRAPVEWPREIFAAAAGNICYPEYYSRLFLDLANMHQSNDRGKFAVSVQVLTHRINCV